MTTCPICEGRRIVTVILPNMKGPSSNRYQSNSTPFVRRNFQCQACQGAGRIVIEPHRLAGSHKETDMVTIVKCPMCEDRGERPVVDAWGDYDAMEFCSCDAGVNAENAERARLDAIDLAEFDAHYAHEARERERDQLAASQPAPDLNAPPF